MAHVAEGHAAFHGQGPMAAPVNSMHGPCRRRADVGRWGRARSLAPEAPGRDARSPPHRAGCATSALGAGSGWPGLLDLAGADAEGQGPEGAMGAGVAVAADDGGAGKGEALLGPDHVDDALAGVQTGYRGTPISRSCAPKGLHLLRAWGPGYRAGLVGTLWSTAANDPFRTPHPRPASFRPSNAWGLVTSCTRWRSMYSRAAASSRRSTTWLSHSLS